MEYFKFSYTRSRRQRIISVLAAVVIFVTTYALILPAITIDTDTAEKEPGIELETQTETQISDGYPAQTLTDAAGALTVEVNADEGVFPENTALVVREGATEDLKPMLELAVGSRIEAAETVEIAFADENGEEIPAENAYTVRMTGDIMTDPTNLVLVEVKDGKAAVVENSAFTYKQVAFEADAGATYAVVETKELTTEYLSANGDLYSVTVTYEFEAGIPEDSRLAITELSEDDDGYEETREAFLNALRADGEKEDGEDAPDYGLDLFDLTIYGPDGSVVEPLAPVEVTVKRLSLPGETEEETEIGDVQILHMNESGDEPTVERMDPLVRVTNETITATFVTESFSTYTLSWRFNSNGTRYRTSTIHYGYMDGNHFVEFPEGTITQDISISTSSTPAFLIYDAPGYEFASAHLNSPTGTEIEPLIRYYNSRWQYTSDGSLSWANIANSNYTTANQDIYMIYQPLAPVTEGGTATLLETPAEDPSDPTIHKGSQNNNDGTRTLSLSIKGATEPLEVAKLADVILIFDISGSMNDNMDGGTASTANPSRLTNGIAAIDVLANDLLNRRNSLGDKLCRMSLVTFSNSAQEVTITGTEDNFTDNPQTYMSYVRSLSAGGGTNWEKALRIANRMEVDPGRETFVIFVTDGNPTWRMTRSPQEGLDMTDASLRSNSDINNNTTYQYYRMYDVFGMGSSDNLDNNYAAALAECESIVQHNKHLYSVGISSDVTNLDRLMEDCGAGAGHSFTATSEDELTDAFDAIKASIEAYLGWGDVQMTDGITDLTNLIAKAPVVGVDPDSFTYYRSTDDGATWTQMTDAYMRQQGISKAAYNEETFAVEWNMGEHFQLENGVTYKVEFTVWPSQEAMDIVTRLNNGEITYNELEPEIREQIHDAGGVYTLKTNRPGASVTYKPVKKTSSGVSIIGEEKTLPFNDVDPLVMQSMPMSVEKIFQDSFGDETGNGVGADRPEEVRLVLEARLKGSTNEDDWQPYAVPYIDPEGNRVVSSELWLSDANNWKVEFFISPALWDAEGVHRNEGYEYRITETDIEYHYELVPEIVYPYLQGHHEPVEGMDPDLAEKDVYITEIYDGDTDGSDSLTAANVVKGGINLFKHVTGSSGLYDPDTEFTIRGWILDPDGNPYLFDPANDERTDKSKRATDDTPLFKQHQNDPLPYHFYDRNNVRVVYKGHFESTGDIEFKIKDGEEIRFPIIPAGCTYCFWEVDGDGMPTGFVLQSVEGVAQEKLPQGENGEYIFVNSSDTSKYPTVDADNRISGSISGNTLYKLDFYNRHMQPNHISVQKIVTKSDEQTQIYPDKSFRIYGGIWNPRGAPYTFDPALDDREDKSQGIPESEYDNYTWDDHQDDPIAYNIRDKDGNYVVYKGHFETTAEISLELKSGETIEFLDVPSSSTYRFYEVSNDMDDPGSLYRFVSASGTAVDSSGADAEWQPYVWMNDAGYTVVSGTVYEGEDHSVTIKNKMVVDPVRVRLVKVDSNNNELKLNGATFRLYADASHETPATDYEGRPIGLITTGGFADAEETEPLGLADLGELLPGTYYLTEVEPPPGNYVRIPGDIVIRVSEDGTTVYQPDNAAGTGNAGVTVAEDGTVTITVTNTRGEELPSTGGSGTFLYTSGGILLLLIAALIYIFGLRRKGRREFDSG